LATGVWVTCEIKKTALGSGRAGATDATMTGDRLTTTATTTVYAERQNNRPP